MKQLINIVTPIVLDETTKTKIAAMLSSISEFNYCISNLNDPVPSEATVTNSLNSKNVELLINAANNWEVT